MNIDVRNWIGQVTTGHGVMILAPTVLAALSGTMSWTNAVPLLVAGGIGLLWPENTAAMAAGQSMVGDVETLITAYRTGLEHAGQASAPRTSVPAVPAHATAVAGLAALAICAAALSACTNQTPAQVQANVAAAASGLVCVADTSGKVVTAASTKDPAAVKAANAALAIGGTLTTDAACQAAVASGAAAIVAAAPQPAAAASKP
jgi:hypothetical protein